MLIPKRGLFNYSDVYDKFQVPLLLAMLFMIQALHLNSWWYRVPISQLTAEQRHKFPPPSNAKTYSIDFGRGFRENSVEYYSEAEARETPFKFGFFVVICVFTGRAAIYAGARVLKKHQ